MTPTTELYFEAHITIDPPHIADLDQLYAIGKQNGFRNATFILKKNNRVPDDFMTTRSKSYEDILSRTLATVNELQIARFNVRRYKIENTLLDIKIT